MMMLEIDLELDEKHMIDEGESYGVDTNRTGLTEFIRRLASFGVPNEIDEALWTAYDGRTFEIHKRIND